jgi:PAS domain-containing protein
LQTTNLNSLDSPARSSILGSGDELRLVIDTIPAMAWVVLPDGKLEFLNRRWLDYSGLSLQEAIAQPTSTIHLDRMKVLARGSSSYLCTYHLAERLMQDAAFDELAIRWPLVRVQPRRAS